MKFQIYQTKCKGKRGWRWRLTGSNGKIIADDGTLKFWKNAVPEPQHRIESDSPFGKPECEQLDLTPQGQGPKHAGIMQKWINAITDGEELIAPGVEGINSLEIANAMLLSSWVDETIELPIDEDRFLAELDARRMKQ